jgi:adenylate kinase family enzyme
MDFPIFNSKALSDGKIYDLHDPAGRKLYFESKLGSKIDELKEFLEHNSFIGYMLARKMAGKGTYAKMLEEILGSEGIAHLSVGEIVRKYHGLFADTSNYQATVDVVQRYYRGFLSLEQAIGSILNRTTEKVSVPTELILALLKVEIASMPKKALLIDGLPRTSDQISYSLFFRDLVNYRDDPDLFILIEVSKELIDARLRHRLVCRDCHTSKNLLFNPSKFVAYDTVNAKYYLICDNNVCSGYGKNVLMPKEGDDQGIQAIDERIEQDTELMEMAANLQGIPSIMIRSSVPLSIAHQVLEDYEIQQKINYHITKDDIVKEKTDWIFKDDKGIECCTMYSATYVLNLFSQLHSLLVGDKT